MLSNGYFEGGLGKYAARLYFDIKQCYLYLGSQKTIASMYTHVGFRTHLRLFVSLFVYKNRVYLGSVNSIVSFLVRWFVSLTCSKKKTIKENMLFFSCQSVSFSNSIAEKLHNI